MNDYDKGSVQSILYFFILLLLIALFVVSIYAGYILYKELPGEPENLSVLLTPSNDSSDQVLSEVKQFNKNMKFNHNNISYRFFDCLTEQEQRMKKAFDIISNDTGVISFYETTGFSDIEVLCSDRSKQIDSTNSDYFIAGEGGAKEIIQTPTYNIINSGSVLLYDSPNGALKCNNPTVELHELLHVFGFDHSSNKLSLMYPYLSSCNQRLDLSIIEELKRLYTEKDLPDLYFSSFSTPVKKGRYLDLNFTIKNQGTIDAKNVSFTILENKKILETHHLGDIKFGAGVLMKMENLKLRSSDPAQISVVIDNDNNIEEYDRINNVAEINI